MKFKDVKFMGKYDVRQELTKEIIKAVKETVQDFNKLNYFIVEDYVHLLLEESHYNPRGDFFYDESTNLKIGMKVFKGVAVDYIIEHIDDFLLFEYR